MRNLAVHQRIGVPDGKPQLKAYPLRFGAAQHQDTALDCPRPIDTEIILGRSL